MKTKPKKETESKVSPSTWENRYNKAASNQEPLFKKWAEWYKMMYAVLDTANMAPWRSKIYIPMLATKAWSMIAKFIEQEPGYEVTVRNDDDSELDTDQLERIADKVQRKMELDYHNPELTEPMRDKLGSSILPDTVVTGIGFGKVPWVTKTKEFRKHYEDENGIDYTKDDVTKIKMGYNDIEPVNVFNVFMAPSATSVQASPWVIIREFKTLADLKAVTENAGVEIYKNLDDLKGVGASSDRFAEYKKSRENLTAEQDVVSTDQTIDMIEIFECYDKAHNTICTYASVKSSKGKTSGKEWVELRYQKNPYWHGKYPLVAFYVRKKPFTWVGEGIFETTERLQSAANDIFNHYMDNWNLSVDGGIMIEENSQVAEFLVEPGFEMVYKGEKPTQFKFPEPNPNQLTQVMNQLEKSVEQATISSYATGSPMSGVDKTQGTATGVIRLQEAATDMIQFMRDNFTSALKQAGEMMLSNNRQFVNFDVEVPVLKDNKFETEVITPEEWQLQMELRINDMNMQPISKQQKKENFQAYIAQLIQLQTASFAQADRNQDPAQALSINFNEEAEQLAKHYQVKALHKQIMTNEEALGNQDVMANEAMNSELDQSQLEPDEDRLMAAEDALTQLEQVNG